MNISHLRRVAVPSPLLVLVAVFSTAACEPQPTPEPEAAAPPAPVETPQPATTTLTDPEIVMIVMTANSVDSANGEMARQRAENPQVRQFGERMVADHSRLNQQAARLAQQLNVTPQESDVSRQLQQTGQQTRDQLGQLSGADFDRTYMQGEISLHQNVLDMIDTTLLPNAQNPELRSLLEEARPIIQSHLEQARQIQGQLAAR